MKLCVLLERTDLYCLIARLSFRYARTASATYLKLTLLYCYTLHLELLCTCGMHEIDMTESTMSKDSTLFFEV